MPVPTPVRPTISHFYKYSSFEHPEWLKSIILEDKLYVPSLTQLNDPADGRPRLETLSEDQMVIFLFDAFAKNNPGLPNGVYQQQRATIRYNVESHGIQWCMQECSSLLNKELKDYRVYSLSKRYDNLSLWDRYAAHHAGYCLEFANEGPFFAHAKEVIYGESTRMDVTNPEHRSGYWFFCKRQEWSNEEEIRLVGIRGQPATVKIEPSWLTRVILGMHMSEADKELIRGWARQRKSVLAVVSASYDEFRQTLTLNP